MPRRNSWDRDLHPEDMRLDMSFLSRKSRPKRLSIRFSWDHLDHESKQKVMQHYHPFLKRWKKDKENISNHEK